LQATVLAKFLPVSFENFPRETILSAQPENLLTFTSIPEKARAPALQSISVIVRIMTDFDITAYSCIR